MESTSEFGGIATMQQVRVVVTDDQLLQREGIAMLLQRDPRVQVVGRGSNGEEAIELVEALNPDVVLIDIRMPKMDGIQATRAIKARWPAVRVVMLTSFAYDGYVVEALMTGADGYLLKDASPQALLSSVLAVAAGEQVLEPHVAHHIAELLGKQNTERTCMYDGLTSRELQMVAMVARGLVAKEIAHELHISEKTVRNHISNIYRKLGIFDRSQVVLYAIKRGLVQAE